MVTHQAHNLNIVGSTPAFAIALYYEAPFSYFRKQEALNNTFGHQFLLTLPLQEKEAKFLKKRHKLTLFSNKENKGYIVKCDNTRSHSDLEM